MWPAFLHPDRDSLAARCQRAGNPPWKLAWSLVWSIYLFSTPLFTAVDPAFWWSIVLSFPLFLLLFAALHLRPYDETSIYVAALALLGGVTMLWNPSAWTYAVFACCYVPYQGSLRGSMWKMILIVALLLFEAWLLHWPGAIMVVMAVVSISAGAGTVVARANVFKDSALRMSHDEVRRLAATAERERIGRDLHDLLGHTLSLIALKSELARKLFDRDPAAAQREIGEVERVARHALAEVRAAVTGIRVSGLAAELASARLLLQASNVHFEYRQDADGLPADLEHDLALVLREAVTNIHRHARATRAEARVAREGDDLLLAIDDNGRGGIVGDGNGLRGMRERVRALGGALQIESPRGRGTKLRVRVPCPSLARPEDVRTAEPQHAAQCVHATSSRRRSGAGPA